MTWLPITSTEVIAFLQHVQNLLLIRRTNKNMSAVQINCFGGGVCLGTALYLLLSSGKYTYNSVKTEIYKYILQDRPTQDIL